MIVLTFEDVEVVTDEDKFEREAEVILEDKGEVVLVIGGEDDDEDDDVDEVEGDGDKDEIEGDKDNND